MIGFLARRALATGPGTNLKAGERERIAALASGADFSSTQDSGPETPVIADVRRALEKVNSGEALKPKPSETIVRFGRFALWLLILVYNHPMKLTIETGTENQTLRKVSQPIKQITAKHRKFAADMVKAMDAEQGVGLAAPQVGENIRMIICKLNPGSHDEIVLIMINPEIVSESEERQMGEEGCLSLPGVWGQVERAKEITLRYQNLKGHLVTLELSDFNAVIVQHEIDHLNGVLFSDLAEESIKQKALAQNKKAKSI